MTDKGQREKKPSPPVVPPGTPLSPIGQEMVDKLRINNLEWLQGDPEMTDQVSRLVDRYQGMFTMDTKRLGRTDCVKDFVIKTIPGTVPVKQRTRPLTPKQKEELKLL